MRKRAVFFDLGGTILVMRRDKIISKILSGAGYPASPDQVHSAYFKVEPAWIGLYGSKEMSEEETEDAYRQLDAMIIRLLYPRMTNNEVRRISLLTRQMWPQVEKTVPLELYPDAIPTLERLGFDGYKLGLVSNAPPDTMKAINSLGLGRYMSVIVVSGIVGFSKPNPEIFKIALKSAGTRPEETMHVGDLYEADVLGARSAGIQGVLIDRDGIKSGFDCPTIKDLGEIYDFLV